MYVATLNIAPPKGDDLAKLLARTSAVKARAAALREQLGTRRTLEGTAAVCARLRPDIDRLSTEASFAHLCAVAYASGFPA